MDDEPTDDYPDEPTGYRNQPRLRNRRPYCNGKEPRPNCIAKRPSRAKLLMESNTDEDVQPILGDDVPDWVDGSQPQQPYQQQLDELAAFQGSRPRKENRNFV